MAANKWLALRAVIVGWISGFLVALPLFKAYEAVFQGNHTFGGYDPSNRWTLAGSGSRLYDWWFLLLVPFCASVLSGCVVARTHRQFDRVMVLAFFASRCAVILPLVSFFLIGMCVEPRYIEGFAKLALGNGLSLVGILAGGGLFNTPQVSGEHNPVAT